MSVTSFLQRVSHILEGTGVPYMLTGSLAAAYYATPRATQDIDVVIDAREEGIEKLVQGLLDAGLYVDWEAALDAWRAHGQFTLRALRTSCSRSSNGPGWVIPSFSGATW